VLLPHKAIHPSVGPHTSSRGQLQVANSRNPNEQLPILYVINETFAGLWSSYITLTIIMLSRSSLSTSAIALLSLFLSFAHSHSVITYPGWRGDNLHTNGTVLDTNGLGDGYLNNNVQEKIWPYGMQWSYPCESNTISCQPSPVLT
jgi:hypothetical protein